MGRISFFESLKPFSLLLSIAIVAGCTKQRNPALPDDLAENVFAISEVENVDGQTYKVSAINSDKSQSYGEQAKAMSENGAIKLDSDGGNLPERLRFMFQDLEVPGKSDSDVQVVFGIDQQFVTAYKLVKDYSSLSSLEKFLAQSRTQVSLKQKIQKLRLAKNSKEQVQVLLKKYNDSAVATKTAIESKTPVEVLVPLFKYQVQSYGVLERNKNELKEDTSVLKLKATDWSQATHIQISNLIKDRMLIGVDPSEQENLDRLFIKDRIDNKLMSVDTFKDSFQVGISLPEKSIIYTRILDDQLVIYQVGLMSSLPLSSKQKASLANKAIDSSVMMCSADMLAQYNKVLADKSTPALDSSNCVALARYAIPMRRTKVELPPLDSSGAILSNRIAIKDANPKDSLYFYQITKNVVPTNYKPEIDLDSRQMIKVADIKNKEFYFRRTLEDAPVTTALPPGMGGNLNIVKFEMRDSTLVVRKSDLLVNFKAGTNANDIEDLLVLPARYFKTQTEDNGGNKLGTPTLVPTNIEQADVIAIDWTNNLFYSDADSPLSNLSYGSCISNIASKDISSVDLRFDQGVLNFSIDYTASFQPTEQCLGLYDVGGDYGYFTRGWQANGRLKERFSFRAVDPKENFAFVPAIPFNVQNALGYGVWTMASPNPNQNGIYGRSDTVVNKVATHDFRDGKVLTYTVVGIRQEDPKLELTYRQAIEEIVAAWNQAYHKAFKGTVYDREGDYIKLVYSGEGVAEAHVGDLDKNIIHIENKQNTNHGILGVSQIAPNPRSGIIVSDSLTIYAGNISHSVDYSRRNMKYTKAYNDLLLQAKSSLSKDLKEQQALTEKQAEKDASFNEAADHAGVDSKQARLKLSNYFARLNARKIGQKSSLKLIKSETSNQQSTIQKNLTQTSAAQIIQQIQTQAVKLKTAVKTNGLGKKEIALSNEYPNLYIRKAMARALKMNNADVTTLSGILADEYLKEDTAKGGSLLSEQARYSLQKQVAKMQIRENARKALRSQPGCALFGDDSSQDNFINGDFYASVKREMYFTLGHEMGHSQGLTHNFIASTDKANFKESGEDTKRNYSSIMDYMDTARLIWDGLGPYDVHAIRAAHTGLVEINPTILDQFKEKMGQYLVADKFISYDNIKSLLTGGKPEIWVDSNISRRNFAFKTNSGQISLIKDYRYCTDKDLGFDPLCKQFDAGTNPAEIMQFYREQFQHYYVNLFYSWDRQTFDWSSAMSATGAHMSVMIEIRKFLDEYFYQSFTGEREDELVDYLQAANEAWAFLRSVIQMPDSNSSFLELSKRLTLVPGNASFIEKDEDYRWKFNSAKTDLLRTKETEPQLLESRTLKHILRSENRFDTIGTEMDKVMALNLFTMNGFPSYRYAQENISFSFLDFEKFSSATINPSMRSEGNSSAETLINMMIGIGTPARAVGETLVPVESEDVSLNISNTQKVYASIDSILSLEKSSLLPEYNQANRFKVGISKGSPLKDRTVVPSLETTAGSQAMITYWAVDGGDMSNLLVKSASRFALLKMNEPKLNKLIMNLIVAAGLRSNQKMDEDLDNKALANAKNELAKALTALNSDGGILSRSDKSQTISSLVDDMANTQILRILRLSYFAANQIAEVNANPDYDKAKKADLTQQVIDELSTEFQERPALYGKLAMDTPVVYMVEKLLKEYANITEANSQKAAANTTDETIKSKYLNAGRIFKAIITETTSNQDLEVDYAEKVKTLEFLSQLTRIVNPEYNN